MCERLGPQHEIFESVFKSLSRDPDVQQFVKRLGPGRQTLEVRLNVCVQTAKC